MTEIPNVSAEWNIEINVDCPNCDYPLSLPDDYQFIYMDHPKIKYGEKIEIPTEVTCSECDFDFTFTIT